MTIDLLGLHDNLSNTVVDPAGIRFTCAFLVITALPVCWTLTYLLPTVNMTVSQ